MTFKTAKFTCAYCGKEYTTNNYNKNAKNHFCCREHAIKYRKEVQPSRGKSWKINNCTCDYCGKGFHKVPSAVKSLNFCGRKCQNTYLAHKVRDEAQKDLNCTCAFCGKKFHRKHSATGEIQFCDSACRDKYREEQRKLKEHEEVCPTCGKKFIAGIEREKFCSVPCQIAWQRRYYKKVKCAYCGKEMCIDKTRQETNKSGLYFCSNNCVGKYYRGSKSPVFKGTRSVLGILRSYYSRYQRVNGFIQHKNRCQVCGSYADHVHHIYPLYKIVEDYINEHNLNTLNIHEKYLLAYNIIQESKIFSDEKNLIALCETCHREHHRKGAKIMNITNIDYGMSDNSYSIFVSGCSGEPKCEGCFNPENWDFNVGKNWITYTDKIKKDLTDFKTLIKRIIIVGGEPLDQDIMMLKQMLIFLKQFEIPIFLFTRYSLSEVPSTIKEYCDFIKCGAYIPSLTCDNNIQQGIKLATSNQKIYEKGIDY